MHVIDSQAINIGPEKIEDFVAKKNQLHHNGHAIHVEKGEQVFVRHNAVYENGGNLADDLAYNFGLWLEESNQNLLVI